MAALLAVVATTAVGGVGAAGAAEEAADTTVYAVEEDGGVMCFSTDPNSCGAAPALNIEAGDTVTWAFTDTYTQVHNAASDSPNWTYVSGDPTNPHVPTDPDYTFTANGTYEFICQAHPFLMTGTVTVTGGTDPTTTPTTSPTATATATATPTATATTQPSDPNAGNTPPPTGGTVDTVKPRLTALKLAKLKTGARLEFRLSEPATVTVKVRRKGSKKVIKTVTVQAKAGKRTVTVKQLKKGRYTLELSARDSRGNKSSLSSTSLRLNG